ncbi:MAG TPA: N-6 DNA methylase [Methylomirabilota bacterium]|jgi:adenine-specific DNA methylase|nr:N-6 DNA methylase [Methylomirabilota bacterium]
MNFIENETPTKLRGGYYTDLDIACFLTRWVLETSPKRILEPSCGDGAFVEALTRVGPRRVESFTGFEIERAEAAKAQARARNLSGVVTEIHTRDFLAWSLSKSWETERFDGCLGNPPFIRYQYLDKTQQVLAAKIFGKFGLKFTKHTNAWVPFIIAALDHLNPGGRLAMVVPAEILHVLHAQSLRQFLLAQCSKVVILDPEELWFDKVLQGVVLLFAEKKLATDQKSSGVAVVNAQGRGFLTDDPAAYVDGATFTDAAVLTGKWTYALLTVGERALLAEAAAHRSVFQFSDVADVDVGVVTGANEFFLVADDVVERYKLQRWAFPAFGRSEHVPGIIYDRRTHEANRRRGLPTNLIWFGDEHGAKLSNSAREYISLGEDQKLHHRYKCRVRSPWYTVPSVYSTNVGMLKRCHDLPRLVLNSIGAFTTDTAYRIRPKRVAERHLVFSFVNPLTALTAELEGRHYGGGVLELVPSEIERLLVPLAEPRSALVKDLDRAFRESRGPQAILAMQTRLVLAPIGISAVAGEAFGAAWLRLRSRRQRNGVEGNI